MTIDTTGVKAGDGWTSVGDQVAGTRDTSTGRLVNGARPVTMATTLRQLFGLACGASTIAALYFGRSVLVPITLAIMLSFILSPMVNLLQRFRFFRVPAVVITVSAAVGLIAAIGMLIGTQAASLSVNAPQYARAIETKVQSVQGLATQQIQAISKALGSNRKPHKATGVVMNLGAGSTPGARPPVLVEVAPPKATPMSVAATIVEPIIGPLETTFIVLMVAIFVLMQKEDLRDRFIRVFGANDLHRTTMALDDAGKRLSRYFIAQLAVNTSFGLVVAVGLWLFGIPSPAMWGVMAAMLRFVPYIGAVLAAVAPVALGAAIDPGWATAIFIALYFVGVEVVVGYIIEPLLYGHSTGLSPVSVIISAIFWTWLWGPVGLVLSTPLTLCLVVLGRHVKALEIFDIILGDRPALTSAEGFYQRILANNIDEVLAQAEVTLGECSVEDYYDDVIIPALRMAAADEARGVIEPQHSQFLKQTMMTVVDELAGQTRPEPGGRPPVPISAANAITCVAGSGPFDDVVASMLQHVLERRGFRLRLVAHENSARGAIANLDLTGTDAIALAYLQLEGAPAQLRFLIRRLRQKAPASTVIAGLWSKGELALRMSDQSATGADVHVNALADMAVALTTPNVEKRSATVNFGSRLASKGQ